jgi:hypothetical protein
MKRLQQADGMRGLRRMNAAIDIATHRAAE